MDPNEIETFDIGRNAEDLGGWYLFLRYVFPALFGLIVIFLVGAFLAWFLRLAAFSTVPFTIPSNLSGS